MRYWCWIGAALLVWAFAGCVPHKVGMATIKIPVNVGNSHEKSFAFAYEVAKSYVNMDWKPVFEKEIPGVDVSQLEDPFVQAKFNIETGKPNYVSVTVDIRFDRAASREEMQKVNSCVTKHVLNRINTLARELVRQ